MKKFLIGLLICINFISCSKSEKDNSKIPELVNSENELIDVIIEEINSNFVNTTEAETEIIEPFDVFKEDMFINISPDPEIYRNNSNFLFEEKIYDINLAKGWPLKEIIVEDDIIIIHYFPIDRYNIDSLYTIQEVTLKKRNDVYFLGNLFGKTPLERNSCKFLRLA